MCIECAGIHIDQGLSGHCLELPSPSTSRLFFYTHMFPKILGCLGFNSNQCEALASGLHPATDFEGKPLPSLHSTLAGKPIAGASVEHPDFFVLLSTNVGESCT